MEHQTRRSGLVAIAVFLAAAALLFALWRGFLPGVFSGEKQVTIEVVNQAGDSQHFAVQTRAQYLKEAAESVLRLEGEDSPYGFVVYTINGVSADFRTGTAYWAIYVNGEYGNFSVDQQPVEDGSTYSFVYEAY